MYPYKHDYNAKIKRVCGFFTYACVYTSDLACHVHHYIDSFILQCFFTF